MPTIILDAVRSAAGGEYHSSWEVVYSEDIDPQIFVYSTLGDEFSHVASVEDMLTLGVTSELSEDFYRKSSASVVHDDLSQAVALIDIVKGKTDNLVKDYDKVVIDFVGSETSSHTF